jgi:hypothetical protein
LDIVFRLAAALTIFGFGIMFHSNFLIIFGILMGLAIPSTYHISSITHRLRQRGIAPTSSNEQTIPVETAECIIEELRTSARKIPSNTILAQQTLNIFETLNARPPTCCVTMGFLGVYAGSILISIVFCILFAGAYFGKLPGLFSASGGQPAMYVLEQNHVPSWSPQITNLSSPMVATFSDRSAAEKANQDLSQQAPQGTEIKLFGQSLIISLPSGEDSARKDFIDKITMLSDQMTGDDPKIPTAFSLSCAAPDEKVAQSIENNLRCYFYTLPQNAMIPPWLPDDPRSITEIAEQDMARKTYLDMQKMQIENHGSREINDLAKELSSAEKTGNPSNIKALYDRIRLVRSQLLKQKLAKARDELSNPVAIKIADLFIKTAPTEGSQNMESYQEACEEMARYMGQLPMESGRATPESERFTVRSGMIERKDLHITVRGQEFKNLADGVPALVTWLANKGCKDFKYEFHEVYEKNKKVRTK